VNDTKRKAVVYQERIDIQSNKLFVIKKKTGNELIIEVTGTTIRTRIILDTISYKA